MEVTAESVRKNVRFDQPVSPLLHPKGRNHHDLLVEIAAVPR
jgi:hypothetical protein